MKTEIRISFIFSFNFFSGLYAMCHVKRKFMASRSALTEKLKTNFETNCRYVVFHQFLHSLVHRCSIKKLSLQIPVKVQLVNSCQLYSNSNASRTGMRR